MAISALVLLLVIGPVASVSAGVPRTTRATSPGTWDQGTYDAIVQQVAATKPTFPARECNVLAPSYASLVRQVVDGPGTSSHPTVWYYGDAINAAISDCHNAGGGTVVVPPSGSRNGGGIYYSGAITLLSNVDLEIATGATIKFVRNPSNAYYPLELTSYAGTDFYNYSPLVYALNQTNIAVTGGGTLDAQFNVSSWPFPSSNKSSAGTLLALLALNRAGVPVDQRIFTANGKLPSEIPTLVNCPPQQQDWGPCDRVQDVPPPSGTSAYQSMLPPAFVEFNHSANILVEGIKLVNTQFWQIHPLNSENISIQDVTVTDSAHYTDDGVDLDSSRYAVVTGSHITVLDDGIAVKSGYDRNGRELRAPSEDVVIERNTITNPGKPSGAAAVAVGSDMSGGVSDVFAQKNVAAGTGLGYLLHLKTNAYRGGAIQDIYVRNSTAEHASRGVVSFDTAYGEVAPPPHGDVFNPTICGVYIDGVNGSTSPLSVPPLNAATVSRSPVRDVFYGGGTFHTTSRLQKSFSQPGSAFFSNLTIQRVTLVNPVTGHRETYNSKQLRLGTQTVAHTAKGSVFLHAVTGCQEGAPTPLPDKKFILSGRILNYRRVKPTVKILVDRNTQPIRVRVRANGSFRSAAITLDNGQYWYRGTHYVSINLHRGIDVNTFVYDIAAS